MSTKLTRKEAFAAIKKLLGFSEEFTNVKCSDGTILKWTGELKEGVAVMEVGADGNEMPAQDKTYEVEDGSKITTVGGLVTAVEQKPADEPADMEQMQTLLASALEKFNALAEKFTALETSVTTANQAIAGYTEKFTAIEKMVTDGNTSVEEKFTAIQKLVEEIADEPAADPLPNPARFSKKRKEGDNTLSASDKIKKYLDEKNK